MLFARLYDVTVVTRFADAVDFSASGEQCISVLLFCRVASF
jgi:hypothetical protein